MTPAQFKEARQSLGLSGVQAAAMLGYGAQSRISEIERGHRVPSASVVRLLRAYLEGYRPSDWPFIAQSGPAPAALPILCGCGMGSG